MDGDKGFKRRVALKQSTRPVQWASFYDRMECWGYPGRPIAAPSTYAEARAATIAFLQTFKGDDIVFHAHTNRRGAGKEVTLADLETAFPVSEEAVEEFHGVTVTKGGAFLHMVYLFPLSSYLWGNTRRFWEEEEDEERDPWGDDDRPYDEEEEDRYEEDDEEPWRRHCTCDANGPYFCSCNREDDY